MSTQTDKIREALELAENMASVFDQLSQKMGDLRERQFDRSRLDEIRSALAALSELDAQPSPDGLMNEEHRQRVRAAQVAQPSAPTVDIHAIAEDLTAHLAKMSLPTDPHGWKVIVRIALIARLTKLLTNP